MTQQQMNTIYQGNVNISNPEPSYDMQGQFMNYFFPEPQYGYDQYGRPQYGSNQIDDTGNLIPQYNKAGAPRYTAQGIRIQGTGRVSEGLMSPAVTGDPTGGMNITGYDSTGNPIYAQTQGQAGDPMFQDMYPQFNYDLSADQAADESTLYAQDTNQNVVRGPKPFTESAKASVQRANQQAQSANVGAQSFEGVFRQPIRPAEPVKPARQDAPGGRNVEPTQQEGMFRRMQPPKPNRDQSYF